MNADLAVDIFRVLTSAVCGIGAVWCQLQSTRAIQHGQLGREYKWLYMAVTMFLVVACYDSITRIGLPFEVEPTALRFAAAVLTICHLNAVRKWNADDEDETTPAREV